MNLERYRAKRDFSQTQEPSGLGDRTSAGAKPMFVVQKHAASHLHYDFRIEVEEVLKSWAVPKGIPTQRGARRLAIQVEDHPMAYGQFEGVIPPGNFGAGTVMIWDLGTYTTRLVSPAAGLASGRLDLELHGRKLRGSWTLVKMRSKVPDDKPVWLLIKSDKDLDPIPASVDDTSARSGRTMEQIAGADPHRTQVVARLRRRRRRARESRRGGSLLAAITVLSA
jgi:bifunctional non-homologous end joining protein LigD